MKRQKGDYASFSVLSNIVQNERINASAITKVTRSSMKPGSGATANCHLRGSGERNGEQKNKGKFSIALVVIELRLSEGVR